MSTKWPKLEGVCGKTPSPQVVKLARSCYIAQFRDLRKIGQSPSKSVFRRSMFFSRFRLFQHVWAYFVVTKFFSDFLWNLAGLRNYSRNAVLRRWTKFDPPYLGCFWRYPSDLSETIDRQVLSPTNRKQPAHGRISTSGFIANMLCRVGLAFAYCWPTPLIRALTVGDRPPNVLEVE